MYSDTKQIYNGHYIDVRGRFYAGQRYVVGKSRQIVKIPNPQQNLEMYDYALIHKQFVESISIPKLQHIIHPRIYNQNEYIIDVYILDCPTRGVDIGVKAYIYDSMRLLAAQGKSIIMVSDELPEAIGMSDRIMVMKNGKIEKVFTRGINFNEESIIEVMI